MNHFKIIFLLIVISSSSLIAQDSSIHKEHQLNFRVQFFQIKEAANYGLVFNGFNLVFGYDFNKIFNNRVFDYSADLAFGPDFNIGTGLNWHLKPLDLFYGYEIPVGANKSFYLGPYAAINYQWQLYPELQSGHMFWFTFIDVGPKLIFTTPIKNKTFQVYFSNSIAGFASRPVPSTETLFYSLTFSDFVQNAHSNFKFGSANLINHTNLKIRWLNLNKKGLAIAYEFEYFGYYEAPKLDYMTHGLNLYWKIGKKKKEMK